MVSVLSLIVCILTILLFIPIKSNIVYQLREKRKRRSDIAEFDVPTEENQASIFAKNLGEKLETNLGRSYELLGHRMYLFFYSNERIS
jgi:hypothetical protein